MLSRRGDEKIVYQLGGKKTKIALVGAKPNIIENFSLLLYTPSIPAFYFVFYFRFYSFFASVCFNIKNLKTNIKSNGIKKYILF